MKKLFYHSIVLLLLMSCASVKKSSAPVRSSSNTDAGKNPRFIENISVAPHKKTSSSESKETYHNSTHTAKPQTINTVSNVGIESATALQIKYAILLNLPIETKFNISTLQFIDDWYGTPYRYGGTSKKGVDCSAFVNFFMSAVYGVTIPRNSKDQYSSSNKIKKKNLDEGDLVFFNTRGGVSHVGVYLDNNKFVHASTSSGVTISDLDDDYFAKRYVGAGRVR